MNAERPGQDIPLSDRDLRTLRRVAAANCEHARSWNEWSRSLADMLRDDNPHLSDVDLARVVIKTAGLIGHYATLHDLTGRQAAGVMAGAAAELASLEIGDAHL